jgi:hypothetical protein
MAELDDDKDGLIDRTELAKCPALLNAIEAYDTNRDGKLSHEELTRRLRSFSPGRLATCSPTFQVLLDGQPLSGATVQLEPERFLGPVMKPAEGITDGGGIVSPRAPQLGTAGVYCGLYRVLVSWHDNERREQIPARYNSATTLGQELAPDTPQAIIILRLSSKI